MEVGGVLEVLGQSDAEEGHEGLAAGVSGGVVFDLLCRLRGLVAEAERLVPCDLEDVVHVHRARRRGWWGRGSGGEREKEEEDDSEKTHSWGWREMKKKNAGG